MITAQVRQTLARRGLLTGGETVLVGCSGGPDSAALLHVLCRLSAPLGLNLYAASVDHGLRSSSAGDVQVASRLAISLNVPFYPLKLNLPSAGASLQARAREARYGVLLGLASRLGAQSLAVGHSRDDQAETVLARLLRGTGAAGLCAIAPRREDGVIRPLIDCPRDRVHAHVQHHRLPHITDPSNFDPRYGRVRIRQEVIPTLLREDPALLQHLSNVADDARAWREAIDQGAARLLEQARSGEGVLDHAIVGADLEAHRRACLSLWLREEADLKVSRAQLEQLDRLSTDGGEVWLRAPWRVRSKAGMLILSRAAHRRRAKGARSSTETET